MSMGPVPHFVQNHVYFLSMQTTVNQNRVQFHCTQLEVNTKCESVDGNQVLEKKIPPDFDFEQKTVSRFHFFSQVQLQIGS